MKIGILGAGAMGSLYGGIMGEKGHQVYFVDVYEEHIEAMKENGIKIHHKDGSEKVYTQNLHFTTDSREFEVEYDLVIVLVKTYITEEALEKNKNMFKENTLVLTLQNGIGNIEKISRFIDEKNIIVGTTSTSGWIEEPGVIMHTGDGGTHIGEIDGQKTDRIKKVNELFVSDHLGPAEVLDDVMSIIWEKLIGNCGLNPLGALTGLKNGQLIENDETRWLQDRVAEEALLVADAENIKLPWNDSSGIVALCKATAPNQTSMLIDVLNKRKTEIEAINGGVVDLAKKHGIATPVNEALVNLVKGKEKSYLNY